MTGHWIERTSPIGQKFVGTCQLCGKTGLTSADIDEPCPNPGGLSCDEVVIAAIDADRAETGGRR